MAKQCSIRIKKLDTGRLVYYDKETKENSPVPDCVPAAKLDYDMALPENRTEVRVTYALAVSRWDRRFLAVLRHGQMNIVDMRFEKTWPACFLPGEFDRQWVTRKVAFFSKRKEGELV